MVGKVFGLNVFASPPAPSSVPSAPKAGSVVGVPGAVLLREVARARGDLVQSVSLGLVLPVAVGAAAVLWAPGASSVLRNVFFLLGIVSVAFGLMVHFPRVSRLWGSVRRFSVGLEGERRVAGALGGLGADFVVLHSVDLSRVGGGKEDADHVVIGPGGVVVVDAKLWVGSVEVTNGVVTRDGEPLADLARDSVRRASLVRAALRTSDPVRAVVAFAGSGGASLRQPVSMSGADFVALGGLVGLVQSLVGSGSWSRGDVERVARELGAFTVHAAVDGDSGLYLGVVSGSPSVVPLGVWIHAWDRLLGSLPWFGWLAASVAVGGWVIVRWDVGDLAPLVGDGSSWLMSGAYVSLGLFAASLFFSRKAMEPPSVVLRAFSSSVLPVAVGGPVDSGGVEPASRVVPPFVPPAHLTQPNVLSDSLNGPLMPVKPVFPDGERDSTRLNSNSTASGSMVVRDRGNNPGGGVVRVPNKQSSSAEVRAFFESRLVLPAETMDEVLKIHKMLVHADEYLKKWGDKMPKGMILHGPPGTGKTHTARTLAEAAGMHFIAVDPSEVRSMWVGQSAVKVKELYATAREKAPTLVFLDEIDAVGGIRSSGGEAGSREVDHALNQLLTEIDGLDKQGSGSWKKPVVFTMGATNKLENLDPALLSRLSSQIRVGLPDRDGLRRLWEMHLQHIKVPILVPIERFVELSERMSGRTIEAACAEISSMGFFLDSNSVDEDLVVKAISKARNSVDFRSSEMRNG